jgi:hypothetical protein
MDTVINALLGIKMPMHHTDMMLCRDFMRDAMWVFPLSAMWKLRTNGKYDLREERLCWMQVAQDLENGVFRSKDEFFGGVRAMALAHMAIQPEGSRAREYSCHLAELCSPVNAHRTMMEWYADDWEGMYVNADRRSFTGMFYRMYQGVDVYWYKVNWESEKRFMSIRYCAMLMGAMDGTMSPMSPWERKRVGRRHNYYDDNDV